MVNTYRTQVFEVARLKGRVKRSWKFIKTKVRSILRTKRPFEAAPPPQRQVEVVQPHMELSQAAPSPQGADPSSRLSAPEANPTCACLAGLSDLRKLEDNPTHGVSNHQETASRRQGTGSEDSIRSDVVVSGEDQNGSDKDSIEAVQHQTQNSRLNVQVQEAPVLFSGNQQAPIQPMLAQNPLVQLVPAQITLAPNTPAQIQLPPVSQLLRGVRKAELALRPLVYPHDHPHCPPNHPPGLPPVTPSRQPLLLDPQGAQREVPINPANLYPSPGNFMPVIPPLGTSPSPKQTTPGTPTIPHTSLKGQGRIREATGLTPDDLSEQALLPRSPQPRPQPELDPVAIAKGKQKDVGVIGDRRAFNHQLQPQVVGSARDQVGAQSEPAHAYPEPIHVRQHKYYVGRYLGGGATGKVYSAISTKSLTNYALKVIRRNDLKFDDHSMVKQELTIMRTISESKHFTPRDSERLVFVNHLVESWFDKDSVYFVMPLCVDTLYDHLQRVKLDPLEIRVYAAELMSGLEALHYMKIMHCDLKPDNILVSPDGHLVITDFGLSVSWDPVSYHGYPSHAFRGRRLAGTDGYMAPEIVFAILDQNVPRQGNYGFSADIWSLGVIFAELGMGGRRFMFPEGEGEDDRLNGHYARTMTLSPQMVMERIHRCLQGTHAMLVERMLQISEANRAGFHEIATHPFFSGLDMAKLLNKGYSVPIPPLEKVLPCRHTDVDEFWSQTPRGRGEPVPGEALGHDADQDLCLTEDIDWCIFPKNFTWDIEEAIKKFALQQAVALDQAQARALAGQAR